MAHEVLQRAIDYEDEREKRFWNNLEAVVQNGVARAFGAR